MKQNCSAGEIRESLEQMGSMAKAAARKLAVAAPEDNRQPDQQRRSRELQQQDAPLFPDALGPRVDVPNQEEPQNHEHRIVPAGKARSGGRKSVSEIDRQ